MSRNPANADARSFDQETPVPLSAVESSQPRKIQSGLQLDQVYPKLAKIYQKCFQGSRNPDKAGFIEFLDQNITELSVGAKYKVTITKRTRKPDPDDMRRSIPAEEENRSEGILVGFSFKVDKLQIILLDDTNTEKKITIDPGAYFDMLSQFSFLVGNGGLSYSDSKSELFRLEKVS